MGGTSLLKKIQVLSEKKKQCQNIPHPGRSVTPDAVVLPCVLGEGMDSWGGDFCQRNFSGQAAPVVTGIFSLSQPCIYL